MQIKDLFVAKISSGEWKPGNHIHSEIQLAQKLKVSQGTVRKAITELVEQNILTRKQGKGTFVAYHNNQRALFHFFHIADNTGHKVLPDSTTLFCRIKRSSRLESSKLKLEDGETVVFIERVRKFNDKPIILETITLPSAKFSKLNDIAPDNLPNMLYELYENKFGITIYNAKEQLRAVAASKRVASLLDTSKGTPLLEIERVALTLNNTPIELRISHCKTDKHHYQNTIV